MSFTTSFRGASGRAHVFQPVDAGSAWAASPGVALFAAPDAFGWRVVRLVEVTGRLHDTRPIWALADAERYGASAVFLAPELDRDARRSIIADIETGMTPVCALDADVQVAA